MKEKIKVVTKKKQKKSQKRKSTLKFGSFN